MTTYVGHRSDILVYTNQKNIEEQFITCFVGFYFSTFLGLLYSCTKIYCIQGNVRGEPNHDGCHRPMDPHPSGRLRFHGGVGQYIAIKKKKNEYRQDSYPINNIAIPIKPYYKWPSSLWNPIFYNCDQRSNDGVLDGNATRCSDKAKPSSQSQCFGWQLVTHWSPQNKLVYGWKEPERICAKDRAGSINFAIR